MTEARRPIGRGEAADEAADEALRGERGRAANPPAEGSPVPPDGPSGSPGNDPGRAARHEMRLSPEERAAVEGAPSAALRGREEDANPSGSPP